MSEYDKNIKSLRMNIEKKQFKSSFLYFNHIFNSTKTGFFFNLKI